MRLDWIHIFAYMYIRVCAGDAMRKPTAEELHLMHQELCSAINDPTRIAILYELAEESRHVSSLVAALDLPQGTVSRHLKILRERGVVVAAREANRVRYALADPRVIDVLDTLRGMLRDLLRRQQRTAARMGSVSATARRPSGGTGGRRKREAGG
ncbi:MAG: metalloregulator ArsR/SmtB family transcription factor [Candidatus Eisenbacteria bacterium]|nr:metalloregulator ArsR/SmtB family transcription factor [Candidatus Eisenbacteria bacterium]